MLREGTTIALLVLTVVIIALTCWVGVHFQPTDGPPVSGFTFHHLPGGYWDARYVDPNGDLVEDRGPLLTRPIRPDDEFWQGWYAARDGGRPYQMRSYDRCCLGFPLGAVGGYWDGYWPATSGPFAITGIQPAGYDRFRCTHIRWGGLLADVAYWFVTLYLLHVAARVGWSRLRQRARQKRGRCPVCGYDLRMNDSGTCPECGDAVGSLSPGQ